MKQPLDIFWFGETARNWIEAVDTLAIAKVHIEKLETSSELAGMQDSDDITRFACLLFATVAYMTVLDEATQNSEVKFG